MYLENYLKDGADWQAVAVMAYLRERVDSITYVSYDKETKLRRCPNYNVQVTRYDNCREQGYTFFVRCGTKQRNYAVYQHRNTDSICVLIRDYMTFYDPTSQEVRDEMKDKWDVAETFSYGQILECGTWIEEDMKEFIKKSLEENK
jgi:hypothetical protein